MFPEHSHKAFGYFEYTQGILLVSENGKMVKLHARTPLCTLEKIVHKLEVITVLTV